MPRTELPADRTGSPGVAPQSSTRRVAAGQRMRMRLRRTAVLTLAVLLAGTATARWLEDPHDVTAASATLAAVAHALPARDSVASALPSALPSVKPSAPPGAGGATTALTSPPTSAAPHADDDSDGSAIPAPNAGKVTVPAAGTGTTSAQAIPTGATARSGRTVRYSVEVENGLPVSAAEFAAVVHTVLTDPRGWQTKDGVRFVPVSPAELAAGAGVDVRVTLASPTLTARLCAPLNVTAQQVSCWNGSRAVLNLTRWMLGSTTYGTDLTRYRVYLISHEVGHGLGHGHVHCPDPGTPAPVMVQQTKTLEGCTASPWPTGT